MKRLLIILVCISPFIGAVLSGYPVTGYRETVKDGFTYTRRCFKVGEFGQFVRCYRQGRILNGQRLMSDLQQKTSSLFPFFDILFFGAVMTACIAVFFL